MIPNYKTMKKYLLTALLSVIAMSAFSQFHFGVSTSGNSTFVLDKGLSEDPRYNSSMTYQFAPIGFSAGVNLGKKFGLQLESIISNQGQIYEVLNATKEVVGKREIDLSYINIPMLLKFMNGSSKGTRANFSFGPQLSLLQKGTESMEYMQSIMEVPAEFASINEDGTYTIIDPSTSQELTTNATINDDGTYNVPALPTTQLLSSEAANQINKFKEAEFQLAAAFGLDIDLGKHLYLTSEVRANYSLTDMRNGDVIELVKESGIQEIFNRRANLLVGVQLSLNYIVGGTRSSKRKAITD